VNCELSPEYGEWIYDCNSSPPVKHRIKKIKTHAKNGGADCDNPPETVPLSESESCGSGSSLYIVYIIIALVLVAVFVVFSSKRSVSLK
jgi:hypothetical protein